MASTKEGLDGWLQRVRKTEEFSDVVVTVNGVHDFRLHMLPLMNASAYFRNLPSSSSSDEVQQAHNPTGCKHVTIPDLPARLKSGVLTNMTLHCELILHGGVLQLARGVEGFAISVDMCYLLNPELTVHNVALVCAAAEFLAMEQVTKRAKQFMHSNIFSHWRSCINFLQTYSRIGSPIDEYIESGCKTVLETACVKSFTEIKHLSAPSSYNIKQSSGALTELLVQVCSLPDIYVGEIVESLVVTDVNLNLKCRQGRNVRQWLDNVLEDECQSDTARSWIILCLSRMLLKNVPVKRPWMELSSQYWCSLLEHAGLLLSLLDNPLKAKLTEVKAMLEKKIGEGLDEIDEYLRDYRFGPTTLLSLVENFVNKKEQTSQQSLREIANDVDQFLWFYAEERSISVDTFLRLFQAFPPSARTSHDTVYGAIEKLLANMPDCVEAEQQQLQSIIDHSKLSPSKSSDVDYPEILETVLHRHSQELADETNSHHLRKIMQKVIDTSLKLLEENSRRSREIVALQKQYEELLDCQAKRVDHEFGIVEDFLRRKHRSVGSHISLSSETEGSESSGSTSITVLGYNSGIHRPGGFFRDDPADCSSVSPCS